jgi:beta-fructofuranosidase
MTNHQMALEKAEKAVLQGKEKVKHAKLRQRWHFMPPTGWMNDPNGLIYFKGKYHIFYQFNPYAPVWGAMHWGHAVSDDLVYWEHLPIALAPSETYDNHERGGCFSGSAVDHNGVLTLIYTGTTNYGDGFVQSQCIATSKDGINFEKYAGNPVIPGSPAAGSKDFRDPKVWKHDDTWYMVVGSCSDGKGKALLYKSPDLRKWEYVNVLCESRGELGYMWECPDLFELDGKYVFMFSSMGLHDRKTVYLVGDMDYKTGKFHYSSVGEVDWGFDYYATQSLLDGKGRRIIVAWANAWDWMPWWKDFGPTYEEGWCGSLSFPRQVELCPDMKLSFKPVEEVKILRNYKKEYGYISVREGEKLGIEAGDGVAYEIEAEINLSTSTASSFGFVLKSGESRKTVIDCNVKDGEIVFDRNESDGWSRGVRRCPLESAGQEKIKLHIFVDTSYIEVYTDNYRTVISGNVFPGENCKDIYIYSNGGEISGSLTTYGLKSIW